MKKRGQMRLSFGMIFSIFLIVVFLAFAIFAIQKFLGLQSSVQVAKFVDDLQSDIDKMWRGSQGSIEKEYNLPKEMVHVCFTDYGSNKKGEHNNIYDTLRQTYFENENLFFDPIGSGQGLDSLEINHINLQKTTESENPFCLEKINGKIKLTIKKDFGESLVMIGK